ncbi:ferredoxin-NADP reductase [Aquamicrobium lusatiense]|uniref:Ferredoxin-NADP reductase n=1 Tax=Aquamicrobium lusatiense TaxID=89772 RepID=A0A7W9VWB0_9HYPH|nr:FAD-binding oxidoreductase [Aquamicrobium lusatiense]MBB6014734.1 ferredoxin-NADP reductase [Aquamicrobium lusatiense]
MDSEIKDFIAASTLLFIASRNEQGALDVSPRGGQPSVLSVTEGGELLLPDYRGNRRLDTISNLLSNPEIALIIVNRGTERFLRIHGKGRVSFEEEHLAAFPSDESLPISVLVLTPEHCEFVTSSAFENGGLWPERRRRQAPLDLSAIVRSDKAAQARAGFRPVPRNPDEELLLAEHGIRDIYGMSSEGVQTKVGEIAGPGALEFMGEARFIVFAHEDAQGRMRIDLTGEAPLEVLPFHNRQAYRLHLPPETETVSDGKSALLSIAAGRSEILRVNGNVENEEDLSAHAVRIFPEEVFFHCPAALNRSRIWQDDRRVFWVGRRRFFCAERRQENPDVVSFVLRPVDRAPVGPFQPGQYVTVSLPHDPEPVPRQRCYSVSGRPDDNSLRISVRRIAGGGVSQLLHDTVQEGTEVLLGIPAGRFTFESVPGRRVALISAGVGITPLLPMLERLAGEESEREIWFLHAARDAKHHLFREEVCALAALAGQRSIRLFTAYSQANEGDICDHHGRIDGQLLATLVPVAETDFYICGPDTFMHELCEQLVGLGAVPDALRWEKFETSAGAGFDLSGYSAAEGCEVTFARSGKSVKWTPADQSLLDLALAQKVKVSYSCRVGDCQSCLQRVIEGAVDYPMGDMPVLAQGQVLLCQAIPRGKLVIDC